MSESDTTIGKRRSKAEEGDLLLRVKSSRTTVRVRTRWVRRWQFLDDLQQEMGVSEIDWTRTGHEPLELWVELNERMDAGMINRWSTLIPVSEILDVVAFMNPYDNKYLMYAWIDNMEDTIRSRLYTDLGRYIRERVMAVTLYLPYMTKIESYAIHSNLNVASDIVRRVTSQEAALVPGLYESIINSPWNASTGILHTAWMENNLTSYIPTPGTGMKEVPWNLIRWDDVLDMAPGAYPPQPANLVLISELIRYVKVDEPVRARLRPELEFHLEGSLDEPGAILSAIEKLWADHSGPVSEEYKNLRRFLAGRPHVVDDYYDTGLPMTKIKMSEDKNGVLKLNTPEPELLLELMIQWSATYNSHRIAHYIVQIAEMAMNNKTMDVTLDRALMYLVVRIAWNGTRSRRQIDTVEYPGLCDRIYNTLGTPVLDLIAEQSLTSISILDELTEDRVQRTLVELKYELLAEEAIKLIESKPAKRFTSWPVIARDSELWGQSIRKPD